MIEDLVILCFLANAARLSPDCADKMKLCCFCSGFYSRYFFCVQRFFMVFTYNFFHQGLYLMTQRKAGGRHGFGRGAGHQLEMVCFLSSIPRLMHIFPSRIYLRTIGISSPPVAGCAKSFQGVKAIRISLRLCLNNLFELSRNLLLLLVTVEVRVDWTRGAVFSQSTIFAECYFLSSRIS